MECTDFELQINDLLDAREPVDTLLDDALEGHIASCAACREWFHSLGSALDVVAMPRTSRPSLHLAGRVVGELTRPVRSRVLRHMAWGSFITAAAAALLVYVILRDRTGQEIARIQVPDGGAVVVVQTSASRPAVVEHSAEPATPTKFDLARHTQHTWAVAWQMLPGLLDDRAANASGASKSATDDRDWSDEVRTGLQPVTRSTTGALDAIWRLLPAGDEEARS